MLVGCEVPWLIADRRLRFGRFAGCMAWDDLLEVEEDWSKRSASVEFLLDPGTLREFELEAFPFSFPASLLAQTSHRSRLHRIQLYLQRKISNKNAGINRVFYLFLPLFCILSPPLHCPSQTKSGPLSSGHSLSIVLHFWHFTLGWVENWARVSAILGRIKGCIMFKIPLTYLVAHCVLCCPELQALLFTFSRQR